MKQQYKIIKNRENSIKVNSLPPTPSPRAGRGLRKNLSFFFISAIFVFPPSRIVAPSPLTGRGLGVGFQVLGRLSRPRIFVYVVSTFIFITVSTVAPGSALSKYKNFVEIIFYHHYFVKILHPHTIHPSYLQTQHF
jgi:hypothetical protein